MKRILSLLLTSFLIAGSFSASANIIMDDDDPVVIPISNGGNGGGDGQHAPSVNPIVCSYYVEFEYFDVSFLFDMGPMSIRIENLATGAYDLKAINAYSGSHIIPFSAAPGYYQISFMPAAGGVFYGYLSL